MKTWIIENILQSRTAWAALLALLIGVLAWVFGAPKTLESWIALGAFLVAVFGGWTAINKQGDATAAKVEIAKIEAGK